MPALNGLARYLALRGAETDSAGHWPPASEAPLGPDHAVFDALLLAAVEAGWQVQGMNGAAVPADVPEQAIRVTSHTVLGLVAQDHNPGAAKLVGVRVVQPEGEARELATHLVVLRETMAMRKGVEKTAVVVPIEQLTLSAYVEHGPRAEAVLDLQVPAGGLNEFPVYLPDKTIQKLANAALDKGVPTLRQRHDIIAETHVGRVALYGHAQLTSTGEAAHAELARTPGVLEVADFVVYSENLQQQVADALAKKGLGSITVLMEHDLAELHGVVSDRKSYHTARELTLRIPGVRGVVSNSLRVEEPPTAAQVALDTASETTAPASENSTATSLKR